MLDPQDKPGSSPDIKKYDYLITGHNVGEIPRRELNRTGLTGLGRFTWESVIDSRFSAYRQRTAEGSETRKQIPHWTSIYMSRTAGSNSHEMLSFLSSRPEHFYFWNFMPLLIMCLQNKIVNFWNVRSSLIILELMVLKIKKKKNRKEQMSLI